MIRGLAGGIAVMLVLGLSAVASPEIAVDADTFDFGTILEGFAVEHSFVLSNVGDETLTIETVRATCGCTTTKLATNVLEPGESVELRAVVRTTGFGGQTIAKQIYVYSNDPRFQDEDGPDRLVLLISGTVLRAEAYHATTEDLYYLSILLIDVRSEADYASGHFLGAVNIPSAMFDDFVDLLPRDNVAVLYDATGAEAFAIASRLADDGFPLVIALDGGLADWTQTYGSLYLFPTPASTEYGEAFFAPRAEDQPRGPIVGRDSLKAVYYVLVDLRASDAFAAGHLIGATNIPIDQFDVEKLSQWLGELPDDAEIIVYDQDGTESDTVAQMLIAAGYNGAKSLLGGLDEWARVYRDELIWADGS